VDWLSSVVIEPCFDSLGFIYSLVVSFRCTVNINNICDAMISGMDVGQTVKRAEFCVIL